MTPKKIFIQEIPCVFWFPTNYDPSKEVAWVLANHGQAENGDGTDASLTAKLITNQNFANLLANCEKLGWVVVMPQLVLKLNEYVPGLQPKYLDIIINYALTNYRLDKNRMYLTGLSQGGGTTWQYAVSSLERANRIAALVPICGTPVDGDFSLIAKSNIPVRCYHAIDDTTIPIAATRNHVAAANQYNPNPKIISIEYKTGGHYIWGTVYSDPELYIWLQSQVNNNVVVIPAPPPEFKPTHKIVRADGSSEQVRIETL